MSILTQLKQKFDTFLSNAFNQSDDYCLILISKMLEELDLYQTYYQIFCTYIISLLFPIFNFYAFECGRMCSNVCE